MGIGSVHCHCSQTSGGLSVETDSDVIGQTGDIGLGRTLENNVVAVDKFVLRNSEVSNCDHKRGSLLGGESEACDCYFCSSSCPHGGRSETSD